MDGKKKKRWDCYLFFYSSLSIETIPLLPSTKQTLVEELL